jgi:type IV pilus assembly protein PilB
MTGHFVLSTIHTEDACSAIDRLKDMGVEPYLIAGSVRGILSQRLVRRICKNCREETKPDPVLLDYAGIKDAPGQKFYHGKGCHQCFDTGYRGRTGVFEILSMNAKLRDIVASGATGTELRRQMNGSDFTPMIVNGRKLIQSGVTTVDEVVRTIVTLE